jgi:hypothetical protein
MGTLVFRLLMVFLSLVPNCRVQADEQAAVQASEARESLRAFLQTYLKPKSGEDRTTRYVDAFADLNDDGVAEAVVYIGGARWCGSGGCLTLILSPERSSYRVVTTITITRPPIRALNRASNGWRDLGVWVQGGGIQPGYEADLSFDGKTYPKNPSAPPARRLDREPGGQVIVASSQGGKPLYP